MIIFILQIDMNSFENNTEWDIKVLYAKKNVTIYKCCPNDTFPRIDYKFLLIRHHDINHSTYVIPEISK